MKRNYEILAVLAVVVIALGGLLWWGYTLMRDKKTEEVTLRSELLEESQKGAKMKTQKRTLALVASDYKELVTFLYEPSEESQIKFLSEIELLGTTTTGALIETKSLNLVTTGDARSFHGEFSVRGTWSQVYHVLRLIEEFPSRIAIERFDVQKTGGNEWSGAFSLDLTSLRSTE